MASVSASLQTLLCSENVSPWITFSLSAVTVVPVVVDFFMLCWRWFGLSTSTPLQTPYRRWWIVLYPLLRQDFTIQSILAPTEAHASIDLGNPILTHRSFGHSPWRIHSLPSSRLNSFFLPACAEVNLVCCIEYKSTFDAVFCICLVKYNI